MKIVILATFSLFFSSIESIADDRKDHSKLPETPIELIDELKRTVSVYTTNETRRNYVKESDLPRLFDLIDSEEPCAYSVISISPHLPTGKSTVGSEAAYLIEPFLMRFYPSKLSSDKDRLAKARLKHWYSMYLPLKKQAEQDGTTRPEVKSDKDYDPNHLREYIEENGEIPNIAPMKGRKKPAP